MEWARWLLFTARGRRVLVAIYFALGTVTVVTYTVTHGVVYALALAVIITFGALWARWCLRRPAT